MPNAAQGPPVENPIWIKAPSILYYWTSHRKIVRTQRIRFELFFFWGGGNTVRYDTSLVQS